MMRLSTAIEASPPAAATTALPKLTPPPEVAERIEAAVGAGWLAGSTATYTVVSGCDTVAFTTAVDSVMSVTVGPAVICETALSVVMSDACTSPAAWRLPVASAATAYSVYSVSGVRPVMGMTKMAPACTTDAWLTPTSSRICCGVGGVPPRGRAEMNTVPGSLMRVTHSKDTSRRFWPHSAGFSSHVGGVASARVVKSTRLTTPRLPYESAPTT
mmetsp:Transcript_11521/g.40256  ORF Transcript_11521/g.40256 Transcript_11521/m.40256 type:complete len:215 (+) Transcript_11521:4880-5524(+)